MAGIFFDALPAYADVTSSYYHDRLAHGRTTTVQATPSLPLVHEHVHQFKVSVSSSYRAFCSSFTDYISVAPSRAPSRRSPTSMDVVAGSCIPSRVPSGARRPGPTSRPRIAIGLRVLVQCSQPAGPVEVFLHSLRPGFGRRLLLHRAGHLQEDFKELQRPWGAAKLVVLAVCCLLRPRLEHHLQHRQHPGVPDEHEHDRSDPLTAVLTSGSGLLSFYNGTAGYTVSYTPSGGAATSDPRGAGDRP